MPQLFMKRREFEQLISDIRGCLANPRHDRREFELVSAIWEVCLFREEVARNAGKAKANTTTTPMVSNPHPATAVTRPRGWAAMPRSNAPS